MAIVEQDFTRPTTEYGVQDGASQRFRGRSSDASLRADDANKGGHGIIGSSAQLAEVRRRIAQVESGEAQLIPGDEALARVRSLLAEHLPSG